jgi:hypothetical protein
MTAKAVFEAWKSRSFDGSVVTIRAFRRTASYPERSFVRDAAMVRSPP